MVAISRIALILAAFVLGNRLAAGILSAGKILVNPVILVSIQSGQSPVAGSQDSACIF